MREINIASILVGKRKEKGITQDELAGYLGVSKAAISKWETGQSYPDITLLPLLAAYFNISIDDLIDYKPQMVKEDIRKLYLKFCRDFSEKPFDKVYAECEKIIKKYYACPALLLEMGALLVNHCMLADSQEKSQEVLEKTRDLMVHIREETNDEYILGVSVYLEAGCEMYLDNPSAAMILLEDCNRPKTSPEVILASAFDRLGKKDRAIEVLQTMIYQNILLALGGFGNLLFEYADSEEKVDMWMNSFIQIAESMDLIEMHPGGLAPMFLLAAEVYITQGREQKALAMLQKYANIFTGDIYPLKLQGNRFFDQMDNWFDMLGIGTNMPRCESVVKGSLLESLEKNPKFESISETDDFKRIVHQMKMKFL